MTCCQSSMHLKRIFWMNKHVKDIIASLQQSGVFNNLELLEILKVLCLYKTSCRIARFNRLEAKKIHRLLQELQLPFAAVEAEGYRNCHDRGKGGWSNIVSQGKKTRTSYFFIGITLKDAISSSQTDDKMQGRSSPTPNAVGHSLKRTGTRLKKSKGICFPGHIP